MKTPEWVVQLLEPLTHRFILFGADVEGTLELVGHAWNEPPLQVSKIRYDQERASVLENNSTPIV